MRYVDEDDDAHTPRDDEHSAGTHALDSGRGANNRPVSSRRQSSRYGGSAIGLRKPDVALDEELADGWESARVLGSGGIESGRIHGSGRLDSNRVIGSARLDSARYTHEGGPVMTDRGSSSGNLTAGRSTTTLSRFALLQRATLIFTCLLLLANVSRHLTLGLSLARKPRFPQSSRLTDCVVALLSEATCELDLLRSNGAWHRDVIGQRAVAENRVDQCLLELFTSMNASASLQESVQAWRYRKATGGFSWQPFYNAAGALDGAEPSLTSLVTSPTTSHDVTLAVLDYMTSIVPHVLSYFAASHPDIDEVMDSTLLVRIAEAYNWLQITANLVNESSSAVSASCDDDAHDDLWLMRMALLERAASQLMLVQAEFATFNDGGAEPSISVARSLEEPSSEQRWAASIGPAFAVDTRFQCGLVDGTGSSLVWLVNSAPFSVCVGGVDAALRNGDSSKWTRQPACQEAATLALQALRCEVSRWDVISELWSAIFFHTFSYAICLLSIFSMSVLYRRQLSVDDARLEAEESTRRLFSASVQCFVPREFLAMMRIRQIIHVSVDAPMSQLISYLVSDVRMFTTISEQMSSDDELFDWISSHIGALTTVTRECNGFVDKFMGDAVMSVFKSVSDALSCGINIHDAVDQANVERASAGVQYSVRVGVGIATGLATIGIIGGETTQTTSVVSGAIAQAAHFEALTKGLGARIVMPKSCVLECSADVLSQDDWRSLGSMSIFDIKMQMAEVFQPDAADVRRYKRASKELFEQTMELRDRGLLREANALFDRILALPRPLNYEDKAVGKIPEM